MLPALSLVAGVLVALASPWDAWVFVVPMLAAIVVATVAWAYGWTRVTTAALIAGFAACGAANAAQARERALIQRFAACSMPSTGASR